ncbi:MAG: hypothetical protein ABI882_19320, partial [Acidobacteriota bacterium]
MKRRMLLMLAGGLLVSSSVYAQTAAPKTAPAAAAPANQATKTKIGILSFLALREMIAELKVRYDKLQAEFSPRAIELDALQGT